MIEFFKTMLPPWAIIIIILGLAFLFFTRRALNKAVNDASIKIRARFFNFNRKGEERQKNIIGVSVDEIKNLKVLYKNIGIKKIDDIYLLLDEKKKVIQDSYAQKDTLFGLWKFYMFSFLNIFLVPRSKLALLWINNNPNVTKEMFCLSMVFPLVFDNKEFEKEAVFSALLSHSLIQKNSNDLYSITNIGIDFLKFIGFLK